MLTFLSCDPWENSLTLAEIQKVILMVIYNLPIAYVRQFTG